MARAYLQGQKQGSEPELGSECPDGLQHHHHHVPSADDALGIPHPRSGR